MPYHGQNFGSSDGAPPLVHTAHELSRLKDMIDAAFALGGKELQHKVFLLVPDSMKLEFNYSSWTYVSAQLTTNPRVLEHHD